MTRSDPLRIPRWMKDPLILTIVGIFAITLSVNGVMLWYSLRRPPELVTPNYYQAAEHYGQTMAAVAESERLHWHVELLPGATRSQITVKVTDQAGHPLTGLTGRVEAYRPSSVALDQSLPLREVAVGSGEYQATFTTPQQGAWKLSFDIQRGKDRLGETLAWSAP